MNDREGEEERIERGRQEGDMKTREKLRREVKREEKMKNGIRH
jgi:hypothetical protein